jgi:hypothetical protein
MKKDHTQIFDFFPIDLCFNAQCFNAECSKREKYGSSIHFHEIISNGIANTHTEQQHAAAVVYERKNETSS